MIFAQIHPKKLEGAPRFSQKKPYLHLDSTQFVGRDTLKQICPKSFPSLLSLFLLFGFIARFCFPKSPSCICYTLATDPQISIALFSLSPSNSVFLVLMLHSLLCLFNSLWIPSPGFHLSLTVSPTFSMTACFVEAPSLKCKAAEEAANCTLLLWCHLCLGHLFHTRELMDSLTFWVWPGKHLARRAESVSLS